MKTDRIPNLSSQRHQPQDGGSILQRLRSGDPSAVDDCAAVYGEYVTQLARNNMPSDEEAANAADRIFDDIHTFAREQASFPAKAEPELIQQIAVRSIVKQQWGGRKTV